MSNKQPKLEGRALKDYADAQAEAAMAIHLSLERERIEGYVREDLEPNDSVEEYFDITETEERVIDALLEESEGSLNEITQDIIDKGVESSIAASIEDEIENQREEIELATRKVGREAVSRVYGPRVNKNIRDTNYGFRYGLAQTGLPSLGKRH